MEYFLADELKNAGRIDEALVLATHALAGDEFVPYKIALVLRLEEASGRHSDAEQLYEKSRTWWPGHPIIIWDRIYGMMDRGDFNQMNRFTDELASENIGEDLKEALAPIHPVVAALNGGDLPALRKLCPLAQPASFKRDLCMLAFVRIGARDDAFSLADRIFPDRVGRSPADQDRIWLTDPYPTDTDILTADAAAPLRHDARFLELARQLGLLAYWKSGRPPDFCRSPAEGAVCAALSG